MSELRELLHDAAPTPSAELDVDALLALASTRRRPWGRIGLWLGGLAVAIGLTGGAVGVLSPSSSTGVDTTPAPSRLDVPLREAEHRVASENGPTDDSTAATSTTTTTKASDSDRTGSATRSDEGCHVDARGSGVVAPAPLAGGAGDDDMSADRCGFVATEPGGYRGTGTWSVTIERDGVRTTYAHYLDSPACADDVIQPGDIVTVTVRTAGATANGAVDAGPGVGCVDR